MRATAPNHWDPTNKLLYEFCARNPLHADLGTIIAKVIVIGRVYAAAIERQRDSMTDLEGDDFYFNRVGPLIRDSNIDQWIGDAREAELGTEQGMQVMVEVHGRVTGLFRNISGKNKRSLASKYLHFHVPDLFYILDSRALASIRKYNLAAYSPRFLAKGGDAEYIGFVKKCEGLRALAKQTHGYSLSPRHIDNMLLGVKAET